ncbi:MAG: hypothetical protein NWE95_09495 [Candidatus Bathyarchaeota archaeon]|nr:hypothetical protein [Candidatus Bathyarchaeota archaeon]
MVEPEVLAFFCLTLSSFLHRGVNFTLVKSQFGCIKKAGVALLFLLLLCSAVIAGQFVNLVSAQTYSNITIMSDGSVAGTDLIQRNGDVYTFTGDIFGAIKVEKDGITIDGAGYAIRGNENFPLRNPKGIDLRKDDAGVSAYGNVVVKNVRFCDNSSIFASSAGNCFINNTFEGGGIEIRWSDDGLLGSGNIIKYNVFIDGNPAIFVDWAGGTVVTENDFINCVVWVALYGRAEFDRNYWSDYKTLFPDAKEIGHTGIWDTPYNYTAGPNELSFIVDYNPLVNPTNGAGAPKVNDEPTPVPTTSTDGDESRPFPTALIIATAVVSVVIVSISLLVYFKKHK